MSDSQHSNGKVSDEPEQFRKLFIGGLSLNTTDESLRDFYGTYGDIVDCIVMKDGATKKSRGFGFVTYSSKAGVDEAMKNRPHTIDGKTVDPKRAVPRDQSSRGEANISTQRLYVSGVREEHNEEIFRDYFKDFGTVTKVEIISDKQTGKPRGFGFVTFEDYDSVDRSVLLKSHMIAGFRCDVKKALSKDEMARAQQMEKDRAARGVRSRGGPSATVAWQGPTGGSRGQYGSQYGSQYGGPAGPYREPHSAGGYGSAPWGGQQQWGGAQQAGQWSGYGAPSASYGGGGQGQWGQQSAWGQQQQPGWSQQSAYANQWPSQSGSQQHHQWGGRPY